MTGLEIIRAPGTTVEQIADIVAEHCPPVTPEHCDKLSCRECWLAWLATMYGKWAVRQADGPGRGRSAPQPRRDVRQSTPQSSAYASRLRNL